MEDFDCGDCDCGSCHECRGCCQCKSCFGASEGQFCTPCSLFECWLEWMEDWFNLLFECHKFVFDLFSECMAAIRDLFGDCLSLCSEASTEAAGSPSVEVPGGDVTDVAGSAETPLNDTSGSAPANGTADAVTTQPAPNAVTRDNGVVHHPCHTNIVFLDGNGFDFPPLERHEHFSFSRKMKEMRIVVSFIALYNLFFFLLSCLFLSKITAPDGTRLEMHLLIGMLCMFFIAFSSKRLLQGMGHAGALAFVLVPSAFASLFWGLRLLFIPLVLSLLVMLGNAGSTSCASYKGKAMDCFGLAFMVFYFCIHAAITTSMEKSHLLITETGTLLSLISALPLGLLILYCRVCCVSKKKIRRKVASVVLGGVVVSMLVNATLVLFFSHYVSAWRLVCAFFNVLGLMVYSCFYLKHRCNFFEQKAAFYLPTIILMVTGCIALYFYRIHLDSIWLLTALPRGLMEQLAELFGDGTSRLG
jgi:hypothetical protein